MPPTHKPFRFEAAILSRMRSEVTSRSNWANESSTLSVSRPIEGVVLNCWVTETKETLCWCGDSLGDRDEGDVVLVEQFDQLGKVSQRSGQAIDFVNDNHIDLAGS